MRTDKRGERRIWAVLRGGIVVDYSWAVCRTREECTEEQLGNDWGPALKGGRCPEDGWDAVPTEWRRVPDMLQGASAELDRAAGVIRVHGARWLIAARGRPRSGGQQPDAPEEVIEDCERWAAEVNRRKAEMPPRARRP